MVDWRASTSHHVIAQRHVLGHKRRPERVEHLLRNLWPDRMLAPRCGKKAIGISGRDQRRMRRRNRGARLADHDHKSVRRA